MAFAPAAPEAAASPALSDAAVAVTRRGPCARPVAPGVLPRCRQSRAHPLEPWAFMETMPLIEHPSDPGPGLVSS
ncbi:hypothetical protein GCM10011579_022710 [Streptomyces albiflavescens]|uniref:Uncharacterized protein n=1 Tax=Streptomyces albiflavescens TaxID=1623582 RepID=A0A917XYI0_9ACTN|nr:hypothetical protein GCM10011579_022710 [Streptomyces albiflavescens]